MREEVAGALRRAAQRMPPSVRHRVLGSLPPADIHNRLTT